MLRSNFWLFSLQTLTGRSLRVSMCTWFWKITSLCTCSMKHAYLYPKAKCLCLCTKNLDLIMQKDSRVVQIVNRQKLLCFFSVLCLLLCASVSMCLVVTCWEKGWNLGSRLWCLTVSLLLSNWYPGSVWYLIVSIPDLCTLKRREEKLKLRWQWNSVSHALLVIFSWLLFK